MLAILCFTKFCGRGPLKVAEILMHSMAAGTHLASRHGILAKSSSHHWVESLD